MPQTGQSPVLPAGAALLVVADDAASLNGVLLVLVAGGAEKVKGAAVAGAAEPLEADDAPNVNGDEAAEDELFVTPLLPPKVKVGTVDVGAGFLSAAAGAPNEKGVVNDGTGGNVLFVPLSSSSSPAPPPSPSSSHVEWSASSYAMPHTEQSPVFSFGLALTAAAVFLLVEEVVGPVNVGNLNGVVVAEVVDVVAAGNEVALPEPNLNPAADTDADDDGAPLADAAGVPKLNDGRDDVVAAEDEEEDRDGARVAPKENGATAGLAVTCAAADLSLRASLSLSVSG